MVSPFLLSSRSLISADDLSRVDFIRFLIQIREVEEQQRIEREKKEKLDGTTATTVADPSKGKTD